MQTIDFSGSQPGEYDYEYRLRLVRGDGWQACDVSGFAWYRSKDGRLGSNGGRIAIRYRLTEVEYARLLGMSRRVAEAYSVEDAESGKWPPPSLGEIGDLAKDMAEEGRGQPIADFRVA